MDGKLPRSYDQRKHEAEMFSQISDKSIKKKQYEGYSVFQRK